MISIIIPVYNAARYLRETIESILNQSYGEFELIVINDGSTDNSQEIIEEFAKKDRRIQFLETENNGAPFARNTGLQIAQGEFALFFDADDVMLPDALKKMVVLCRRIVILS